MKQFEEKSFEISNNTKMIDFPLVAYDSKNYHVHLDRLYNKVKNCMYVYLFLSCHVRCRRARNDQDIYGYIIFSKFIFMGTK